MQNAVSYIFIYYFSVKYDPKNVLDIKSNFDLTEFWHIWLWFYATEFKHNKRFTYFRPQSEYLAMFFNVKAAVSLMCLVIGPSLSSWTEKTKT